MTILAIAQINSTVGDIAGNAEKTLAAWRKAASENADLVVFPELSLTGYSPEDLVLFPAFRRDAMACAERIAVETKDGPAILLGCVWEEKNGVYNAGVLMDGGAIIHVQYKTALPNYGVFDEHRVFQAAPGPKVTVWRGKRLGILVCEDTWEPALARQLKQQNADIVISINASPFESGKLARRHAMAKVAATAADAPLVYANIVGGQDDIVFDGGSFVMDAKGNITTQLPEFEEGVFVLPQSSSPQQATQEWRYWQAMKMGLSDYVHKNGFQGVMLGLSGGIDSALTAALAVEALGSENVHGILLPSPYTSKESIQDAQALAKNLGMETSTVSIEPGMQTMDEVLSPVFKDAGWMENISVGGNVQARLRGLTLMAISNRFGWLLLSTANKSELAVGYSTLYGDSCGGYNVLKDLYKSEIYALSKWHNRNGEIIPARCITKPPSAELAPGQTDEDQLPPYDVLDAILLLHIDQRQSAAEIVAAGYEKPVVEKIVRMVQLSEYKRRQSCPGVKLSTMQFGKDRRYPLTNAFKEGACAKK